MMKGRKVMMNRRNAVMEPEEDLLKTKETRNMNIMFATPKASKTKKTMRGSLYGSMPPYFIKTDKRPLLTKAIRRRKRKLDRRTALYLTPMILMSWRFLDSLSQRNSRTERPTTRE